MDSPWTGVMEDDVIRVCVKDSWQPPALLLENFRVREYRSLES